MNYKEALRQLHAGTVHPVYLCYGTESYLMDEFIEDLTRRLIPEEEREFAVGKFDLTDTPVEAAVEDAETLPFLASRKLVVARNATFLTGAKEQGKAVHQLERLSAYANRPMESAVLVLAVMADKLDERKKIVKQLKERAAVVVFAPLAPAELQRWVVRGAEQRGCVMSEQTADKLIRQTGSELQRLSAELDKLSLYAGSSGEITPEAVEQLAVRSTEYDIFSMIDAIAALRIDHALQMFYELLKRKEEPVRMVALITRQFRHILLVKALTEQGLSPQAIAAKLRLAPYAVKVTLDQARKFDHVRLRQILTLLGELDYEMKSGRVEKVFGLEMFLMKLCG